MDQTPLEEKNQQHPHDDGEVRKNKPVPLTRGMLMGFGVGILILASLFGAVFGYVGSGRFNLSATVLNLGKKTNPALPVNQDAQADAASIISEDAVITETVQRVSPAVVSVVISKNVSDLQNFDPFGFLPDPFGNGGGNNGGSSNGNGAGSSGSGLQQIGAGTGFFVSSDGMIVTNKHVVSDRTASYSVVTTDGKEHQAKVLARDPVQDIAVIKIDGTGYPTLQLGNSDDIKIGQTVISIGNALGQFSNTVSRGIISGHLA